jgi:hypothetical protein
MKIGFDVHGVLDLPDSPYLKLAHELAQSGSKIHVITGLRRTTFDKRHYDLMGSIKFKFFSISDYIAKHVSNKIDLTNPDNPRVNDKELWDSIKAEYARMQDLDLMFDDTPAYLKYFTTPVVLVQNRKTIPLINRLAN